MKEFYEPMLYLSTPEHPNTMSVVAELKEPIDGDILQSAVILPVGESAGLSLIPWK